MFQFSGAILILFVNSKIINGPPSCNSDEHIKKLFDSNWIEKGDENNPIELKRGVNYVICQCSPLIYKFSDTEGRKPTTQYIVNGLPSDFE